MSEKDEEKKSEKSDIVKKLQKKALEDIKPNKGSPDSLTDDEPSLDDVTKKGKEKSKKAREESRE